MTFSGVNLESSTANAPAPVEYQLSRQNVSGLSGWALEFIQKYLPDQLAAATSEFLGLFQNKSESGE